MLLLRRIPGVAIRNSVSRVSNAWVAGRYFSTPANQALPSLPDLSPRLREIVFAHSSLWRTPRNTSQASVDSPVENNERLAFVGDTIIQLCVSEHLWRQFPYFQVGELTILRSHIVGNEQLSQWATQYRLHEQLLTGPTCPDLIPSGHLRATLLEAYAGASQLYNGPEITRKWIFDLVYTLPHLQTGIAPGSLGELSNYGAEEDLITYSTPNLQPEPQIADNTFVVGMPEISDTGALFMEAARRKVHLTWSQHILGHPPHASWKVVLSVVSNHFEAIAPTIRAARLKAAAQALDALGWRAQFVKEEDQDGS